MPADLWEPNAGLCILPVVWVDLCISRADFVCGRVSLVPGRWSQQGRRPLAAVVTLTRRVSQPCLMQLLYTALLHACW